MTTSNAPVSVWPLAPLQEGLLFHALGDESVLDVYSMQSTYRFSPAPDGDTMRAACAALLERHDVLRAGFTTAVADRPVQFIPAEVPLPYTVEDLRHLAPAEAEAALDRVQRREREARFVMDRPPLIRFVEVRLPSAEAPTTALVVTNHHILYDGWSDALLIAELLAHLAAGGRDTALPAPPSFAAYLAWLAEADDSAAIDAWRGALDGLTAGTLVADERPGDTVLPGVVELDLGAELTRRIEELARACAVSVSTVYSTAWALMLRALTGRDDVVFGTTVSGRPAELDGIDRMVGLFLNTVPQRVVVDPHARVSSLLGAAHRAQAAVLDAHHVGLGAIQRAMGLGPLFDTLYVMRNTPKDDDGLDALAAATGLTDLDGGDATHYPLTFIVHPGADTRLILSYREDAFTPAAAQDILDAARRLLATMADGGGTAVGALAAWHPDAASTWLEKGCSAVTGLGEPSLIALLERSARATPERPALIGADARLDYAQLWNGIVATALSLRAAGVRPGDLVGIDLARGARTVVGILAVLASGAAYVPVDPSHPAAHRARLLDSAGVDCVLSDQSGAEISVPRVPVRAGEDTAPSAVTATQLHPGYRHDDLAYVIHTSGSTGEPKAVQITHAGLVNMLENHRRRIFEPAGADPTHPFTVAHAVSFAFDMSWEELLWLVDGHTVLVLDEETRHDPGLMVRTLDEARVDVVNVTPSLGEALVEAGLLEGHRPRLVLLGGEAVTVGLWNTLRDTPGVVGYNLYGPTEYTINTLGGGTDDSSSPIVGSPIDQTDVFVLDTSLQPVADGVPGELWVAGIGLAHGYRGRAALTAERFVACPFGAPGRRMYRTGDIVARRANGHLDFLGRGDDQVKIRGHRVEPGQVQAVLARSPHVSACAVLARPTPTGAKALVAYVVAADAARDAVDTLGERLRAELRAHLPEHLVPSVVMTVPALPLTVNSKLDVRALPEPDFARRSPAPPRTAREGQICAVFGEVLGLDEVGAEDDLFLLGGHSLTAMRAATLLSARLDRRVSVAAVMAAPTPRALALRLQEAVDPHAVLLPLGAGAARRALDEAEEGDAADVALPVVFVHGALGIGWSFSTLAARQPGRPPAWALQSPGLSGWPHGVPSEPAALVAQLVDALMAGLGPHVTRLRIVGWSFGAHLAGHLEGALAEHGISVAEAVLLDPGMPTDPGMPADPGARRDETAPGGAEHGNAEHEALAFLVRAAGTDAPSWLRPPYARADVLAHLAESTGVFSHFTEHELDALLDCYAVNVRLLARLEARLPRAETVLVSATLDTPASLVRDAEEAWQALADAAGTRLRTVRLDTDHDSFTTPSRADALLRLLSGQLV